MISRISTMNLQVKRTFKIIRSRIWSKWGAISPPIRSLALGTAVDRLRASLCSRICVECVEPKPALDRMFSKATELAHCGKPLV
jgi:hypothetical protein